MNQQNEQIEQSDGDQPLTQERLVEIIDEFRGRVLSGEIVAFAIIHYGCEPECNMGMTAASAHAEIDHTVQAAGMVHGFHALTGGQPDAAVPLH